MLINVVPLKPRNPASVVKRKHADKYLSPKEYENIFDNTDIKSLESYSYADQAEDIVVIKKNFFRKIKEFFIRLWNCMVEKKESFIKKFK